MFSERSHPLQETLSDGIKCILSFLMSAHLDRLHVFFLILSDGLKMTSLSSGKNMFKLGIYRSSA